MEDIGKALIGSWRAVGSSIGGRMEFRFHDNGRGLALLPIESNDFQSIEWKVEASKLTISDDDVGLEVVFKIKHVDEKLLKMKMHKLGGARQYFGGTREFVRE